MSQMMRMPSRRGLLALGGITGASILGAALGGTTLAAWNATAGFTLQPVESGNLDIRFGVKDAYAYGLSPDTGRPGMFRAAQAIAEPPLMSLSGPDLVPVLWLLDVDLDNAGDNLGAWLDMQVALADSVLGEPTAVTARLVDRMTHPGQLPTLGGELDGTVYAALPRTPRASSRAFTMNPDYTGMYQNTQVSTPEKRIIIDAENPMRFTLIVQGEFAALGALADLTELTLGDVLTVDADYTQVRIS